MFCTSALIGLLHISVRMQVTTADGYILSLQRIPRGRGGGRAAGARAGQPVLLQHGVLVVRRTRVHACHGHGGLNTLEPFLSRILFFVFLSASYFHVPSTQFAPVIIFHLSWMRAGVTSYILFAAPLLAGLLLALQPNLKCLYGPKHFFLVT
jgi:hypothetical protein